MNSRDKTKEELIKELQKLQKEFDSFRISCKKKTSELRQAERKARMNEETFRKAYMTSPDSININRLSDGMFVSVNDGFTRILGYNEKETIGKTSLELNIWANPDDRKRLVKVLESKGEIKDFEANFLAKDGTVINGLMSASLIDLDGERHIYNVTRDISIRKNAEDELAKEQYLLSTLMDNLPDYIYFKDRESRFIRINKNHARSFGLSDPSQAIGKTDFDFFTREHAQQAYNDEQTIIRTGQMLSIEEKETHHDRPDTWVSTIKLPLHDKEGNIIGTFGISRDITERKLVGETLLESEEHYRVLFNEALDGICLADTETGLIIDCNKTLASLVGRERVELIGKSQKILHPPRNNDAAFSPEFEQHLADKEGKILETQIITSAGLIREVEIKANHIIIRGRKTLQGVFRDITERKKAEEELAQEQYLMRTLMDNLPDHIYFKDSKSRFIRINKALARFIGLNDPDQAVGKTDFDFFTVEHAQQAYNDEQNIIRTGHLLSLEEKETHHNRPDTWVSTIKLPMRDKEGNTNGTFGISRDITERKKTDEEIKLKNELLQTINAEKDKFFSIIAHDLKGPLSAFLGATQILIEEIQNMTLEEIKEITVSMKESATNIYGLLENLLEWSRLKQGRMDFNSEVFNVKQKISACIEVLSESAKKKEIKINYSLPEDLTTYADSHMLETIVRNLVSNAIKFTPKSGEIGISAAALPDNTIEIKIRDSGIGMSQELMNKLFLLTEKTSRKGTEGEPSTGLGLLLCKEFIEKYNGKIWVESAEGKGSTFSFTLPDKV
jgi:two-component system, sensor histidine kinase and response regulator